MPVLWRDCKHCQVYQWNETTNKPDTFRGRLIRRKGPPPCGYPVGCKKGHYNAPLSLEWMNWRALEHWYECMATSQWPDDQLVRERAGKLLRLRQLFEQSKVSESINEIFLALRTVT